MIWQHCERANRALVVFRFGSAKHSCTGLELGLTYRQPQWVVVNGPPVAQLWCANHSQVVSHGKHVDALAPRVQVHATARHGCDVHYDTRISGHSMTRVKRRGHTWTALQALRITKTSEMQVAFSHQGTFMASLARSK